MSASPGQSPSGVRAQSQKEMLAEIARLRAIPQEQYTSALERRLAALEWYQRSVLLGGVVCRRAEKVRCSTSESEEHAPLGPIECAPCTNAHVAAREAGWEAGWWGLLTRLGEGDNALEEALALLSNSSASTADFSCPPSIDILPPLASGPGSEFRGEPAAYPSIAQRHREQRHRRAALRLLHSGLGAAEASCGLLAEGGGCADLDGGCAELIGMHPLQEGAVQAADRSAESAVSWAWSSRRWSRRRPEDDTEQDRKHVDEICSGGGP